MRARLVALVAIFALTLVPTPASAADATITTSGMAFVPAELTVQRGDGLVHNNADGFDHNVTSVDRDATGQPLFAGATIGSGQSTRVEGVEELAAGSYDFVCSLHAATMRGTLTVEGSPDGAPRIALAPLPGVFQLPVAIAQHPESDDLFVVEKTGFIRAVRAGLVYDPVPVLDLRAEVSTGLEQGLLGVAFSPDGDFLYVNMTDTAGDTHILEFAFANGVAVPASRREVLSVEQPFANHNGGTLIFGPDGYLYIALGDGGSAGDPNYNAQNLGTRLGKMLRIDPRPSGAAPFTVPADNPFVPDPLNPDAVPPGALPEIWAYGLRNPWKFSFDKASGDLWIGDVGQNTWEEVNLQRAGAAGGQNYGWNHMEGRALFAGRPAGALEPPNHTPPIHVYGRDGGACSVTGGYVYRGASAALKGAYVYSDWCDGRLRYLREVNGQVVEEGDFGLTVPSITAFGEDHDGELYAISLGGTIFKIVPLP